MWSALRATFIVTVMGRVEPRQMRKCRLAPDRSLTPALSHTAAAVGKGLPTGFCPFAM
jgi:hypothetical protein